MMETNVTVGTYINVFDPEAGYDIYVLPNESNAPPTPDEVDAIQKAIVNWSNNNEDIHELYERLYSLELKCLECDFNILGDW